MIPIEVVTGPEMGASALVLFLALSCVVMIALKLLAWVRR